MCDALSTCSCFRRGYAAGWVDRHMELVNLGYVGHVNAEFVRRGLPDRLVCGCYEYCTCPLPEYRHEPVPEITLNPPVVLDPPAPDCSRLLQPSSSTEVSNFKPALDLVNAFRPEPKRCYGNCYRITVRCTCS